MQELRALPSEVLSPNGVEVPLDQLTQAKQTAVRQRIGCQFAGALGTALASSPEAWQEFLRGRLSGG